LQQLPFEASSRTTLTNCEAEQPLDLTLSHKNVGLKEIPAKKNLLFGFHFEKDPRTFIFKSSKLNPSEV